MQTTKNVISLILCALLLLGSLAGTLSGCGEKNEKLTVVCTVFPIYDWVRSVVGDSDRVEVALLVSDGADLHSYQPTAKDALTVRSAALTVRVGGLDDSFVTELLKDSEGVDLRLMEAEGVTLRESAVNSSHSHGDGHHHPTDEHIWLSLKNAVACVGAIEEALCQLDPEGAEGYASRAAEYAEELNALDKRFSDLFSEVDSPKMIFADRFPFIYLTADYGVEFEAAFEGCTTDAEAGFDTVIRLADRLKEWQLSHVFVTESSDMRLPSSVIKAAEGVEAEIAVLDSMQSMTSAQIDSGADYISVMNENLLTLSAVFSTEK